ncbi:MAG: tyrosine-type recombinase/integrase [Candidatus Eisenbacteria bacterium]|uniref:Tyrosine-type recombinase/integrase n=1 Tax=Eiseniibacteriota bacterium TaxID=2212470 RepID=A0A948W2G8_UNCEI|nr:tyrosine-type recombinase/integrase [Candidatus Eisenbacteria bacterium]MBU1948454.1 tyrosine-type recombinase/integrase [Candidatus Eisenbacteria bacterium]MBU2689932.1 tyrosine-type recombinase/integrase [Candidatus Eisenbacteria bacterium]
MKLKDACTLFANANSINDISPHTRRAYTSDLRQLNKFLKLEIALAAITPAMVNQWAQSLADEGYLPASRRRKLATTRVFFNYCVQIDLITISPMEKIRFRFPMRMVPPPVLSSDEARQFLATIRATTSINPIQQPTRSLQKELIVWRNRAIVELLLSTGMRVGELTNLNMEDLDTIEGAIRIRGKGQRFRQAFVVDPIALEALQAYKTLRLQVSTTSSYLFLNRLGNRLGPQGVALLLRMLANSVGIQRRITPHMLRHTAATLLILNGADIRLVQEVLGHSSISTTQRYTHITKPQMKNMLIRYNHMQALAA